MDNKEFAKTVKESILRQAEEMVDIILREETHKVSGLQSKDLYSSKNRQMEVLESNAKEDRY